MKLEVAIEMIKEAMVIENVREHWDASHKNYEKLDDISYSKSKHDELLKMARNILVDNYYERRRK